MEPPPLCLIGFKQIPAPVVDRLVGQLPQFVPGQIGGVDLRACGEGDLPFPFIVRRPFPYYRVFFTSDLMSYLTQVEPGRASFRHQRDIERAILFAFVNFCAVQPCRRLDDIRRMEPKTYGAVLWGGRSAVPVYSPPPFPPVRTPGGAGADRRHIRIP